MKTALVALIALTACLGTKQVWAEEKVEKSKVEQLGETATSGTSVKSISENGVSKVVIVHNGKRIEKEYALPSVSVSSSSSSVNGVSSATVTVKDGKGKVVETLKL